jgi:ubiquinone/menaquinone biosynthesis C-methylase UbiE
LAPHGFIAAQLRQPTGLFGRLVIRRFLNRGNAELIAGAVEALELAPDDTFLDLGFGGGLALKLAATKTRAALWGVDFSPEMVAAGAQTFEALIRDGRLNLICADVADLPLRDGVVRTICTTNTIYFWPDLLRGLRELRRVLAPGGRLAIGFNGATKMRKFGQITQHGFTLYEPDEVERAVREAGFTNVRTIPQTGRLSSGDYVCHAS